MNCYVLHGLFLQDDRVALLSCLLFWWQRLSARWMAGFPRCLAETRLGTPTAYYFHPGRPCTDTWVFSLNDTGTFSVFPWWPISEVGPVACPTVCHRPARLLADQSFYFLCFCC
uniref:Putative secreted protein n=1 Tax=Anopheles darlingi TaxID=43151 RepID=A0A2M4DI76_ANODA